MSTGRALRMVTYTPRSPEAAWRQLATAIVLALVSACSPDISETDMGIKFLEVSGVWNYSASEVRRAGSSTGPACEITGVVLELAKVETAEKGKKVGAFSGKSSGGGLSCAGELAFLSGPLVSYAIADGYSFNEFISFDFGSPDWRHDGLVVSSDSVRIDSMSGKFALRNAGVVFEGKFLAVRRPSQ